MAFCWMSCVSPPGNEIVHDGSDTLSIDFDLKDKDCAEQTSGFFKKLGFVISNFYEVAEIGALDVDGDGEIDTLAILNPKNRVPNVAMVCAGEKKPDRVLLLSIGEDRYVFDNVVRNELGPATLGVEHINEYKGGFNLSYRMGQACYLTYDININYLHKEFYIHDITLRRGGCPGDIEQVKTYDYSSDKLRLRDYKRSMTDSLILVAFEDW